MSSSSILASRAFNRLDVNKLFADNSVPVTEELKKLTDAVNQLNHCEYVDITKINEPLTVLPEIPPCSPAKQGVYLADLEEAGFINSNGEKLMLELEVHAKQCKGIFFKWPVGSIPSDSELQAIIDGFEFKVGSTPVPTASNTNALYLFPSLPCYQNLDNISENQFNLTLISMEQFEYVPRQVIVDFYGFAEPQQMLVNKTILEACLFSDTFDKDEHHEYCTTTYLYEFQNFNTRNEPLTDVDIELIIKTDPDGWFGTLYKQGSNWYDNGYSNVTTAEKIKYMYRKGVKVSPY